MDIRNAYAHTGSGQLKHGPKDGGFVGEVPAENPWRAAYPTLTGRGRLGSHMVFGRVRRFRWQGSGNLSIKTVFSGHAQIESDGGMHRVEPGSNLLIDHGREYCIEIESDLPVEGFSVFFDSNSVASVCRSRSASLDDKVSGLWESLDVKSGFFERTYEGDELQDHLTRVYADLPGLWNDPLWVQEQIQLTLNLVWKRHLQTLNEVHQVQAVRAATREELYRRLYKARDYAYATLDQPISLDDLAYVACLSTNYFLRSFRGLFKQTPHQFIIDKRMSRAKQLLKETEMSVSEVCLSVGFQSLGSFSWLFKRRVGLSPEAFRRAAMCRAEY